ncbi:D-stereospecific phenylhydantoinase [Bacteroidales bacterium]|nr:D-stereospecific phenylhydantoinase [Bacteroidales bacterium]
MTKNILIKDALIINEGSSFIGSVLIENQRIAKIYTCGDAAYSLSTIPPEVLCNSEVIEAKGLYLMPGVIDDQVHFREPGLTHKGDIYSESRAAVAGGTTSFMDMPNTNPQTTTVDALNQKFDRAAETSLANFSFFIGSTNDNISELKKAGAQRATAVKVFMGSSTGNMLVDNAQSLERLFGEIEMLIAAHCESEPIVRANIAKYTAAYGIDLDISFHSKIRSAEACYASSSEAVALATKHNSRLHIFHLSTAKELQLLEAKPMKDKRITGEVCVHHLWFSDADYPKYGNRIKWNPSIKTLEDREALRKALVDGRLDVVATDHAPHTLSEKEGSCLKAASGGPMVQHSLLAMLELCTQGVFSKELIVEKMCHAPAELFSLRDRGYIREAYYADMVLVDPKKKCTVAPENILYKCAWSPLEGEVFSHQIHTTFVNGHRVYDQGNFDESEKGMELEKK